MSGWDLITDLTDDAFKDSNSWILESNFSSIKTLLDTATHLLNEVIIITLYSLADT